MALNLNDIIRELDNLKSSYLSELGSLQDRAKAAVTKRVSSHDAFNMAATCQNLAVLAGKIEQTENVIRWMDSK